MGIHQSTRQPINLDDVCLQYQEVASGSMDTLAPLYGNCLIFFVCPSSMLAYEQLSGRNHIFNLSIAKFAQDLDHTVCFTDDFLKDRKNELYTKLFVNASPTKSR